MRTKKMQEGGMPAMNKMAQRKAMTQKAAAGRSDTFRDPEHGSPSMPLAADVERNFTGTTAMGDPYTADQPITIPGSIQSYTVTTNDDGTQTQTANYSDDVELPGIEGADISGSGAGPLQTGEEGMMLKRKDMKAEKGMMMKKFKEGGFSVMDPADFVAMLRDNRKK
jgi:hypothetical protein